MAFQAAKLSLSGPSLLITRSLKTHATSIFSGWGHNMPFSAARVSKSRYINPSSVPGKPRRAPSSPRIFINSLAVGDPLRQRNGTSESCASVAMTK